MRIRRPKTILLLLGVLVAALAFTAATQTWVTVTVSGAPTPIVANASVTDPSLSPIALALLALVGALALAGRALRYVLGAVQVLLGAVVIATSASALAHPLDSATSAIAKATALSGEQSIAQLATGVDVTGWPWVALVAGVLVVFVGAGVLVTARSWASASRRYDGGSADERPVADRRSRTSTTVDDWDALSAGADPTDTER